MNPIRFLNYLGSHYLKLLAKCVTWLFLYRYYFKFSWHATAMYGHLRHVYKLCITMNASEEALHTKQLYVKQYFFCHGSRALVSLGLLYEVPRSQSDENATLGRTPSDEWSARRRHLYLTTHNTQNKHPRTWWDSNPQSQQANGRTPTS
jgi:hypothetical protein